MIGDWWSEIFIKLCDESFGGFVARYRREAIM